MISLPLIRRNRDKVPLRNIFSDVKMQEIFPFLPTDEAIINGSGQAQLVTQHNFPALKGVCSFIIEIWDESMRVPHWHPNCYELGYVSSYVLR